MSIMQPKCATGRGALRLPSFIFIHLKFKLQMNEDEKDSPIPSKNTSDGWTIQFTHYFSNIT